MSEGKKEILLGDCLELMKDIPNESIDMILCDLPYGTTACKWDTIIPFEPLWEQYKRVIKDNGAIVLTSAQPFTSNLVMSNPKWYRHHWVWVKEKGTGFQVAKYRPMMKTEDIIMFKERGGGIYNPQMTVRDKPLKYKYPTVQSRSNPLASYSDKVVIATHKYPENTLNFKTQTGEHPTQKPVALFEYLIKTYTNEGDLVLDNCAGSGTTAIACLNTKRQFIVMEKEQKYYDIILKRVGDFNKNFEPQTLFGNDAQLERLSDETMTPEKLKEEISKSKAISDIGKVVVESAKAEILYAKLTGKKEMNPTTFLEEPSRDPNIKALKDKYNNKEA